MATLDPRTGLPVVGMIGGGQLARMTATRRRAGPVAARAPPTPRTPPRSSRRRRPRRPPRPGRAPAGGRGATVVTFDHEHVPNEHLARARGEASRSRPARRALVHAQDKLVMRARARRGSGCPSPRGPRVDRRRRAGRRSRAEAAGRSCSRPPRGGYDGKGVLRRARRAEARRLARALAEARGERCWRRSGWTSRRELAAQVARSPSGQVAPGRWSRRCSATASAPR